MNITVLCDYFICSYAKLHGSLWEENFQMMELTESMRQRDDHDFAQLLMRVRTATCTKDDITLLKSRVVSKADPSYPKEALHVFKTNKEVDDHNSDHLKLVPSRVFNIQAIDKKKDVQTGLIDVVISSKPSDTGGLRKVVSIAVGARVMVTININVSDGLANGVCGTVIGIDSTGNDVHAILVKFDSGRVGKEAIASSHYKRSYPGAVPIKRQDVQFFAGTGRRSVEAKRTQFPLTLAWGCTIHKVQGKTLDAIVVSMEGRSHFMPGQAYVALSRVKTLHGLYLLGFDAGAIRVNPSVVREMDRLRSNLMPPTEHPTIVTPVEQYLNIRLLNIRSYMEHLEDMKSDHTILPTDVFCFVETFLTKERQLPQCDRLIPDAACFRADRPATVGTGGGVMTMASRRLAPATLKSAQGLEHTAIAVTKDSIRVNVVTIYRPPSMNLTTFSAKLKGLVESIQTNVLTVLLGDFNIDLVKCPHHNILQLMKQLGFHQHVKSPTTDYGSLLDHVYVNRKERVVVDIVDTYYSDHDTVCVALDLY